MRPRRRDAVAGRVVHRASDTEHVLNGDGIEGFVAQRRRIARECHSPLLAVLPVAPAAFERGDDLIRKLPKVGVVATTFRFSVVGSRP